MKNRSKILMVILPVLACFAFLPGAQATCRDDCDNFGTFQGDDALISNTLGTGNTAFGWRSLFSNTDGSFSTGVGAGALVLNNADSNTAVGAAALLLNTSGTRNTAVGTDALVYNDSGNYNDAVGAFALFNNINGFSNNAFGDSALVENIHGFANTAIGDSALLSNDATGNGLGNLNTAVGALALFNNTDGTANTAVGAGALFISTGSGNIALGDNAGGSVTTANNVTCIGALGANVDNSCFIGNIYSNVQPIVGTNPDSVTITFEGRLGRGNVSSRRYKHGIKPMDNASEAIYALKPVSFRYNKEYDATQTL